MGGSCPCDEHRAVRNIVCPRRGRILHLAYDHSNAVFDGILREMAAWVPQRFDNDVLFMTQVECCVRSTIARAREKLHYLEVLPYLLCRLGQGLEVARLTLDQLTRAPPERQHRVTLEFLAEGSLLRGDIIRLSEGEATSERL